MMASGFASPSVKDETLAAHRKDRTALTAVAVREQCLEYRPDTLGSRCRLRRFLLLSSCCTARRDHWIKEGLVREKLEHVLEAVKATLFRLALPPDIVDDRDTAIDLVTLNLVAMINTSTPLCSHFCLKQQPQPGNAQQNKHFRKSYP